MRAVAVPSGATINFVAKWGWHDGLAQVMGMTQGFLQGNLRPEEIIPSPQIFRNTSRHPTEIQ